jgi:hypothetical protein
MVGIADAGSPAPARRPWTTADGTGKIVGSIPVRFHDPSKASFLCPAGAG